MITPAPRSTRTDTLFPDTTLCRSLLHGSIEAARGAAALVSGDDATGREGRALQDAAHALPDVGRVVDRAGSVQQRHPHYDRSDGGDAWRHPRSEEHTSELQSLMRISYAVFCLKKKKIQQEYSSVTPNKQQQQHHRQHAYTHAHTTIQQNHMAI